VIAWKGGKKRVKKKRKEKEKKKSWFLFSSELR
jgi:hypothetical protein